MASAASVAGTQPVLELKHLQQDEFGQTTAWNYVYPSFSPNTHDSETQRPPKAPAEEHTSEYLQLADDASPRVSPDGGRTAWTQALASFLINVNVYGLVNAFGEFQHFYKTEYLVSYSSSTISWIGTVQGYLVLLIGALAGPIFDK